MWWSVKNVIVSLILSTPPDWDIILPSKDISLLLSEIIGSKIAPNPFPPSKVTDNTFCMSKSCGSTCILVTSPMTTGWTKDVVPVPGDETVNVGGFKTS